MNGQHRSPTRLPFLVAATAVLTLAGALGAVLVHDIAETPETVATPIVTVTPPPRTVTPKPVKVDPVTAARAIKPLAKLVKGDRVIYENDPKRPVCVFEVWGGSITNATIKCPGKASLAVRTGFLTPVEANR